VRTEAIESIAEAALQVLVERRFGARRIVVGDGFIENAPVAGFFYVGSDTDDQPVRIVVEELVGTEDRALAILVPQKEQCQAACQIVRNLRESHQVAGTGRALDLERVAVILMILAEREKNQMIYRHPDGAAPVGIAAKEFGGWGQFPGRDS